VLINDSVAELYESGLNYTPADPNTKPNKIADTGAFVAFSGAKTGYILHNVDVSLLLNLLLTTPLEKKRLLGEMSINLSMQAHSIYFQNLPRAISTPDVNFTLLMDMPVGIPSTELELELSALVPIMLSS
jgi:hypothetical protein